MERQKVQVWVFLRTTSEGTGTPPFKVLLLKMLASRGGVWQPVTGSVEAGETLQEAALREAREETGLEFPAAPISLNFSFSYEGRGSRSGIRFTESCFALEVSSALEPAIQLDPHEHDEFRWVTEETARQMLYYRENVLALEFLSRHIAKET